MRFLFDHDVPDDIAFALVALGHEVLKLREIAPATREFEATSTLRERSPSSSISD